MDPAKLALIEKSITTAVDRLAGFGETALPAYAPAFIVGQAVIDAVPELATIVNNWVEGKLPTDEERAAVAKQIHDLVSDPENI